MFSFPVYFLKSIFFWLAFSLLIGGCQYRDKAKVRDDVLVYCSEGSPETFNPQLSTSGVTFDASSRTIYNRLIEFEPGTSSVKPALANSWDMSDDGKEYTFYLRQNVQFHSTPYFEPSRPFDADDVVFTFEKQDNPNHPFHKTKSMRYSYFEAMGLGELIERIKKVDSHTIKFYLTRAESPFLATLAMDFASILSREYAFQLAETGNIEALDNQPVGTGPFQLVRYQPDAYIRYKAHPDYWQGEQAIGNLVFAITPDPSLRFARLVAGECDVMTNPLPVHISAAQDYPDLNVSSEAGLNVAYLAMNTRKPPFDDRLVRRALNHAIDKTAIINAVYSKTAIQAITPLPPNMWAHNHSATKYEYNPQKARELLAEAGYSNGFDMAIWTMSAQRAYNPNAKRMAELIQQDLGKVNVRVEIVTYEYGAFLRRVRKGEHQSALLGWISDNGDPDNFLTPLLSCASTVTGTNAAFWCDPLFSQLVSQARALSNKQLRSDYYDQAQQVFLNEVPWVPVAHATQHTITRARVKNFKLIPSGGAYFNGVSLREKGVEPVD